jgi:hypothetical protein
MAALIRELSSAKKEFRMNPFGLEVLNLGSNNMERSRARRYAFHFSQNSPFFRRIIAARILDT